MKAAKRIGVHIGYADACAHLRRTTSMKNNKIFLWSITSTALLQKYMMPAHIEAVGRSIERQMNMRITLFYSFGEFWKAIWWVE